MASLFFYYILIPVALILFSKSNQKYDRKTKLLVERERAQAMLKLKSSQQQERDEQFGAMQSTIAEAAKKLKEQRVVKEMNESVVEVSSNEAVKTKPVHKVNQSVWNEPSSVLNTTKMHSETGPEVISEYDEVYASDCEDVDTIH